MKRDSNVVTMHCDEHAINAVATMRRRVINHYSNYVKMETLAMYLDRQCIGMVMSHQKTTREEKKENYYFPM
jgi:hypothetical protein